MSIHREAYQFLGWGSLLAAAGVSYYYARRSINERRAMQEALGERPSEKLDCTSYDWFETMLSLTARRRAGQGRAAREVRILGRRCVPTAVKSFFRKCSWERRVMMLVAGIQRRMELLRGL